MYANDYIGPHLAAVNDGQTYSETSGAARAARAAATEATDTGASNAADLGQEATVLEGKVQTLFRGETLRGLLLTAYGFSVFGVKGGQVATVMYLLAALMTLLSVAGLTHAFVTPRAHRLGSPAPAHLEGERRESVSV